MALTLGKLSLSSMRRALTPDDPWPGLSSYEEGMEEYFFGREVETAELARRVAHNSLTLIYGESGRGKTSLIQAGLLPRLRNTRNGDWMPVHIKRLDFSRLETDDLLAVRDGLSRQVAEILSSEISNLNPDLGQKVNKRIEQGDELWALLCDEELALTEHEQIPRILLVFDQFEEIFTKGAKFHEAVSRFFTELAGIIENRPSPELERRIEYDPDFQRSYDSDLLEVHVVIVIREDYLGRLEQQRHLIPSMMRNRFELSPLWGPQALDAVYKPGLMADPGKPLISLPVAEKIVRLVAKGREGEPFTSIAAKPTLLGFFCRELNILREGGEIDDTLVGRHAESIIEGFYERAFKGVDPAVKHLLEDKLISQDGKYREGLNLQTLLNHMASLGIEYAPAQNILESLENKSRVINIEERGGRNWVEFTHDQLVNPAARSKATRIKKENVAAREKEMKRKAVKTAITVILLALAGAAGWGFGLIEQNKVETKDGQLKDKNGQLTDKTINLDIVTAQLSKYTIEDPVSEVFKKNENSQSKSFFKLEDNEDINRNSSMLYRLLNPESKEFEKHLSNEPHE